MKMDSFLLLLFIIFCFNIFAHLYVAKKRETAVDRDFLFLSAVYFCWTLLEVLLSLPLENNYEGVLSKLKRLFQLLHGIFFLKLVLSFLGKKTTDLWNYLFLGVAIAVAIFSFSGIDLSEAVMVESMKNPLEAIFILFGLLILLLPAILACLFLLRGLIKEETLFKQQLTFTLLVAGLLLIAGIFYMFDYKLSRILTGLSSGFVFFVMVKKRSSDLNSQISIEKKIDQWEKDKEGIFSEELLRLLVKVSWYLLTYSNFDSALQKVLTCLGEKSELDYVYGVMLHRTDAGFVADKSYCWIRKVSRCRSIKLEFSAGLRSWMEALSQREMVMENYDTLSIEERMVFEQWKINSFLAMPIFSQEKFWGVIGFAMEKEKRIWSEDEKGILKAIALRIGGILLRKQDEEFLKSNVQRFEMFAGYTNGLIVEVTAEGDLTYVNQASFELLGYSSKELVETNIESLVHPDDYEAVLQIYRKILNRQESLQLSIRLKNKDGKWRSLAGDGFSYLADTGQPRGILILRDLNHLGKIEEEIIKTEELESQEMLAGSIAHDFKNMLSITWGNILLAKLNAESESRVVEKLSVIGDVLVRAKKLSDKLLTFARYSQPVKQIVDIVEILKESTFFSKLNEQVRVEFKAAEDLWLIAADKSHLIQAFNNLFLNAVEAMNEGGVIRVRVENNIDGDKEGNTLAKGKFVRIIIQDSGNGIPDYCLPQIFEPFFTTKPGKKGLGLTTVYSIIKNHGGKIFAHSEGGAVFHIYLPAAHEGNF